MPGWRLSRTVSLLEFAVSRGRTTRRTLHFAGKLLHPVRLRSSEPFAASGDTTDPVEDRQANSKHQPTLCWCSLAIRSVARGRVRRLAGCSTQERSAHGLCSFLPFHRFFEPAESVTSHVKASSRVVKMRRSRREKLVIS